MMRFISLVFIVGFSQIAFAAEYQPAKFSYHESEVFYEGIFFFRAKKDALSAFQELVNEAAVLHQTIFFDGEILADRLVEETFIKEHFSVQSALLRRRGLRMLSVTPPSPDTPNDEDHADDTHASEELDEMFEQGRRTLEQSRLSAGIASIVFAALALVVKRP